MISEDLSTNSELNLTLFKMLSSLIAQNLGTRRQGDGRYGVVGFNFLILPTSLIEINYLEIRKINSVINSREKENCTKLQNHKCLSNLHILPHAIMKKILRYINSEDTFAYHDHTS